MNLIKHSYCGCEQLSGSNCDVGFLGDRNQLIVFHHIALCLPEPSGAERRFNIAAVQESRSCKPTHPVHIQKNLLHQVERGNIVQIITTEDTADR